MRGKWLRFSPVRGPGLPQVRLHLRTDDVAWDLIAPSRCDLLDADGRAGLIASLGPDPLRGEADPAEAYRRVSAYPGAIGAALLDQSVIAGAGHLLRLRLPCPPGLYRRAHAVRLPRLPAPLSRAIGESVPGRAGQDLLTLLARPRQR